VPLKFVGQNILSRVVIYTFDNKHEVIFKDNIRCYMYKCLEISNVQIYFSLLLQALNVVLQRGKCTPGWGHLD